MNKKLRKNNLFNEIRELLIQGRVQAVKAVNTAMVLTYFQIGRLIVEDEQNSKRRADYGKETLEYLSKKLINEFGKGYSATNLRQMRSFYLAYRIQQTVSAESSKSSAALRVSSKKNKSSAIEPKVPFLLSWSHYILLMRLDEQERNFYEREAIENNWSLRELKRQFDSALYERVALSRNKKGVLKKNLKKYHSPERPEDIVKNP